MVGIRQISLSLVPFVPYLKRNIFYRRIHLHQLLLLRQSELLQLQLEMSLSMSSQLLDWG
jgi:hypothetical protein